jgi:predicted metal-dependent hydrolase
MDKNNLKVEMMKEYEAELDRLLSNCSERQNFKVLEDELEKFAKATLPRMLERLASERGIFPPSVSKVQDKITKQR